MINRVTLVGNLTRDAEPTAGPATTLTRMRIATNSVWRDNDGNRQEHAEFHNVVAFGKLAEICASYCLKGRRVYIEGRLRTREYDGSDGLRRHTTEIVAETMKLLDRPHTDDGAQSPEDGPHEAAREAETSDVQADGEPARQRRARATVAGAS
ncbi:MAG: single-stranded DNA-binding protein [Candidatus Dormibacteraeota bacterium]|uniref:Single-stranded DNA-binding protein n=1 Tax=Candidatus Amunia macphersoniae TaxID=3127014 RepID=A0A934KNH2_9BACT|nr:single-stranded DNA-binding protein [Candidatus Dormibacteraeota bacterium]